MECDQCGAPRPRWGACPECGAPPPRFSSQAGSGGRSQPGSGLRSRSGGNWGGPSGSSPQRGQSADGWDDEYDNYTNAAPSRSGGRFSSGDYGVDPSRALMPQQQYNEVMPPSAEGGLMTGLPGFPQTDEEERAIGMRRPAYIPATEPKRKRKLSSGRVVSGLLSILLVTVGVCGGLGFLGQKQFERVFGGAIKIISASPTVDLRQISATPASTPGPQAKIVQSVVTAHAIDSKYNAEDESTIFLVNSTVYVVANIVGASQTTTNTFSCTWYLNGVNYQLNSGKQTSLPAGKASNFHAYCALPYYQTGIGMVRLYWNRPANDTNDGPNDQYLAQTIKFAVVASMPTTPGPSTPKPGVAPSPTKSVDVSQPVAWRSEYAAG